MESFSVGMIFCLLNWVCSEGGLLERKNSDHRCQIDTCRGQQTNWISWQQRQMKFVLKDQIPLHTHLSSIDHKESRERSSINDTRVLMYSSESRLALFSFHRIKASHSGGKIAIYAFWKIHNHHSFFSSFFFSLQNERTSASVRRAQVVTSQGRVRRSENNIDQKASNPEFLILRRRSIFVYCLFIFFQWIRLCVSWLVLLGFGRKERQ
jgi:hypothetical protein